jgi:hypothetical protein
MASAGEAGGTELHAVPSRDGRSNPREMRVANGKRLVRIFIMRTPVHAIRAKIIGPAAIAVATEERDFSADLKLFLLTYAAGFLSVSLFIA